MPTTKICSNPDCASGGKPQPISAFHRKTRSDDGYNNRCKACVRAVSRQWEGNNKPARRRLDPFSKQVRTRIRHHRAQIALLEQYLKLSVDDLADDEPESKTAAISSTAIPAIPPEPLREEIPAPETKQAPPVHISAPTPARGGRPRSVHLTAEQKNEMTTMYEGGVSASALARQFGAPSADYVIRELKERGVRIRTKAEATRLYQLQRQDEVNAQQSTGNPDVDNTRECLRCGNKFKSDGPHNRLCKRPACRESDGSGYGELAVLPSVE